MSFDFPFVGLFGVRKFCYYPYFLESCGLNMQYINASNIILGIANPLDPDNTKKSSHFDFIVLFI
jgi:hypothetical protein